MVLQAIRFMEGEGRVLLWATKSPYCLHLPRMSAHTVTIWDADDPQMLFCTHDWSRYGHAMAQRHMRLLSLHYYFQKNYFLLIILRSWLGEMWATSRNVLFLISPWHERGDTFIFFLSYSHFGVGSSSVPGLVQNSLCSPDWPQNCSHCSSTASWALELQVEPPCPALTHPHPTFSIFKS